MKRLLQIKLISIFAIIGIVDTSYLIYKQIFGQSVTCSLLTGCEEVLKSQYAILFNQPLSVWGLLYYLLLLALALAYQYRSREIIARLLLIISTGGLLFSGYLVYLQTFVINSWCQYCLLSAVTTITIFLLSSNFNYQLHKQALKT